MRRLSRSISGRYVIGDVAEGLVHAKQAVVGSFGLVGSSNFTFPGLSENVELNVQITGRQVNALQEWYEEYWNNAEDVSPEILRTIERHTREYSPFEVYAKSLQEFFRGHEMTAGEWELTGPENGGSRMYSVLDHYQKAGYHVLMKIARQYRGAFLCDGVGLGKTFVGLMVIERLVMHDRKRVALFVPKAARAAVWERDLRRYLPHIGGVSGGDFSNLVIFSHTDLGRKGDFPSRFDRIISSLCNFTAWHRMMHWQMLLIEKVLITKAEFMQKLSAERAGYQEMLRKMS